MCFSRQAKLRWNPLLKAAPIGSIRNTWRLLHFRTPLQQMTWKYYGKRRNCNWVISPCTIMFSTLLNYFACVYIYRDFSPFCVDVFKVVCCRFDVCWKGLWQLTLSLMWTLSDASAADSFMKTFKLVCCCRIVVWGKGLKGEQVFALA